MFKQDTKGKAIAVSLEPIELLIKKRSYAVKGKDMEREKKPMNCAVWDCIYVVPEFMPFTPI